MRESERLCGGSITNYNFRVPKQPALCFFLFRYLATRVGTFTSKVCRSSRQWWKTAGGRPTPDKFVAEIKGRNNIEQEKYEGAKIAVVHSGQTLLGFPGIIFPLSASVTFESLLSEHIYAPGTDFGTCLRRAKFHWKSHASRGRQQKLLCWASIFCRRAD